MAITENSYITASDFNALKRRIIAECTPNNNETSSRRHNVTVDATVSPATKDTVIITNDIVNQVVTPMNTINANTTNYSTSEGTKIYPFLQLDIALQDFESRPYRMNSSSDSGGGCTNGACLGLCQGCTGGCYTQCSGCSGTCDGCRGTCTAVCNSNCYDACAGCVARCKNGCGAGCAIGCGGVCDVSCGDACQAGSS